jgi:hypothetical protein
VDKSDQLLPSSDVIGHGLLLHLPSFSRTPRPDDIPRCSFVTESEAPSSIQGCGTQWTSPLPRRGLWAIRVRIPDHPNPQIPSAFYLLQIRPSRNEMIQDVLGPRQSSRCRFVHSQTDRRLTLSGSAEVRRSGPLPAKPRPDPSSERLRSSPDIASGGAHHPPRSAASVEHHLSKGRMPGRCAAAQC